MVKEVVFIHVLVPLTVSIQLSSPPMEAVLYHFRGWATAKPPPAASLLKVMGEVADILKETGRPALVMCE